jgi:putative uncharacterized protein FNV0804
MPQITKLLTVPKGEVFELVQDFIYDVNGYRITVPKNFTTDYASVPKALQVIIHKEGTHSEAAVVHDFLYSRYNDTGINRKLADKIFLFIMKECGVPFTRRITMYLSVRSFGGIFYMPKDNNEGYRDEAIIDNSEVAKEYYKLWNNILKF